MQAKRHILISMASPAYNAQTAISISWQYILAPLSFHMIAPKASFQVKADDFNVFLQAMNAMLDQGVDQLDTDIAIETTDGIWSEFGRESQLNAQ